MKLKHLLYIFFLFPLSSFAQEEQALSLSEAIQNALFNNFQIRISEKEVEQAVNNNAWGEAGRYPTVTFNLRQANTIQQQDNPTSFVQGSLRAHSVTPNVDVDWILFDGFRVNLTKEQLELLEAQSKGNAELVVQNTIQSVIMAYHQIQLEETSLNILQETYQLSRDKYVYEEERRNMGLSTSFELLQIQTSTLTDSSNMETQRLNVRNAYRNLNLLMAIEPETRYDLAEDSLTAELNDYTYENLQAKMLSNNQNVINQAINLRLAKNTVDLSKSELYPIINLNLGGNYNNSRFYRGDQYGTGKSWDMYANFTLTWIISNGGRIKRQIENSQIDVEIAQLQQEELELELKNELRSAFEQYNLNKQLIRINQRNLEAAKLQLTLAEERQKSGIINSIDYRNIQLNARNVALQLYESTFQLIQSETELIKLIGGLVNE